VVITMSTSCGQSVFFEADFNWWNKLVFARRMMSLAGENNAIPEELFAKAGSHCLDYTMSKTFVSDVSKVLHHPASLGTCDLGVCYDQGAHGTSGISLRAWRQPVNAVRIVLNSFETMQFCLRTGFGESNDFFGDTEDNPIAGWGQGSGAAPAAFSCLSALMVNAYKRMGHGAKLTSCYAARMFLIAAAMYVDDTDLIHWADSPHTDDDEFIAQVQQATTNFGMRAHAGGGALKPVKCSSYFLTYHTVNGKTMLKPLSKLPAPSAWVDVTQKDGSIKLEPSHISVPQPDGSSVPIPTKDVTEATEMLGMFFAPIGNSVPHIEAMREKGFTWADRLMTRPLPSRDAWLSFFLHLYPAISYGLASAVIKRSKLDLLMSALYYKILPLLGVNRCINVFWHLLSERYQGLGLPNFVADCLAAKLFFVQCKWGFESASAQLMVHAYEAFMVEVGLYGNILSTSFDVAGCLATDGTWFKNLWEFASYLEVDVELAEDHHFLPVQEGDQSWMAVFLEAGFVGKVAERLNRMRKVKGWSISQMERRVTDDS